MGVHKNAFWPERSSGQVPKDHGQLFQEYSQLCAYIDDVAIHSQTWEQHIQDIRKALTLLKGKELTAKLGKCKFACPSSWIAYREYY